MVDVAVVTGAGRGLGAAIAERLARRGMHVVVTDKDEVAAQSTVDSLAGSGVALRMDVTDPESNREVARHAAQFGSLRVWICNAGVLFTGGAGEITDEEVRRQVEVNLLGVVYGCRAAFEVMRKGDLLCLASLAAHGPVPGLAVYAATKAAVLSFCHSVNVEMRAAGKDIHARALCPDTTDTPMVRQVAGSPSSAMLFTGMRLLSARDVADAAVGMLDSPRVVRTLPVWRGLLLRTSALVPRLAERAVPLLCEYGERRRRRLQSGRVSKPRPR
ncbi:SDR family oxidoreductase [Kibdelosporangium philippinense]|uniref:SDR family oxidoreductase n=1 Tax=Kibdelosporangium philippinense TaxID=211113 RepID=A0ABS8Z431_9PSEU|nr:SDR family oxidoreductase [Kibdelosporangium philippinense]MCE7002237.1 SDR family oxidoreductase [Kibdelosporangium philippinense]